MSRSNVSGSKEGVKKRKLKLSARFSLYDTLFIVLILAITIVVCVVMVYSIADNAAVDYARSYTMESVDVMSSHLNNEIMLARHASQSSAIIEWFADEDNPEKKEAAYQKLMLFADMLQTGILHFAVSDSLNEYSIMSGATIQDFTPYRQLDPANINDDWFFSAIRSVFDFTMTLGTRNDSDTHHLWINHKVEVDGKILGVFSSSMEFSEVFQDLFGLYEGQSVRGFVIDYRGIIQIDSNIPEPGMLTDEEVHILSVNTDANFVSAINNNYLRSPLIYYGRRTEPEVIRLSGGDYQYLSIAPIPNTNWLAITFFDTGALFDFYSILPPISAVVLAFLVYVAINSLLIRSLVFKPLGELTQSVAAVGNDVNDIYGIDRNDEIGELARTTQESWNRLNEMTISLNEAAEEAKAANLSKSAFLASMSHEIRTPMNVILGITEILMQDERNDMATTEELIMIYNSGDMLLSIINDILDMSKIEAGKLEVVSASYEAASLIHDTVVLTLMRSGSSSIDFRLSVDENIPATLIGDELRIKQILNNLLSNAFKYTEEGEIILSFSIEDDADNDDLIFIFKVSDTGHGLTREEINEMFDEYTRFHLDINRTTEGTGLGMSITRNLLRLMKGEITVESEPGKGSLFTVRLPQGRTGAAAIGSELAESLQSFKLSGVRHIKKTNIIYEPMHYGKVLIVDDAESNLFVARGLLMQYELAIDTATSGYNAIDKIKNGNEYDIIFMDHMMPKMDGMVATKLIREMGYTAPIVALTANAVVGQSDIFLSNGFDDFISKPVDVRHLNTVLKKYIRDKQPPEVLEAARMRMKDSVYFADGAAQPSVSPQLAEFFVKDAVNAVELMKNMSSPYSDEDLQLYTTTVHAMKTALANVGELKLSSFASNLEHAGLRRSVDAIASETPVFVSELQKIIDKLTPQKAEDGAEAEEGDYTYLLEKLSAVKKSCIIFDKKTAKGILIELRNKIWPPKVKELLGDMAEQLLSGDLDKVIEISNEVEEYIS